MKKITKKQFDELQAGGNESDFTSAILKLKEGELYFISREEWTNKIKPPRLINAYKYQPRSLLYGLHDIWAVTRKEGWVIGRGEKNV